MKPIENFIPRKIWLHTAAVASHRIDSGNVHLCHSWSNIRSNFHMGSIRQCQSLQNRTIIILYKYMWMKMRQKKKSFNRGDWPKFGARVRVCGAIWSHPPIKPKLLWDFWVKWAPCNALSFGFSELWYGLACLVFFKPSSLHCVLTP